MDTAFFVRAIADYFVIPIVLIGTYALLRFVPSGSRFRAYARILMAGLTAYLLAKLVGTIYQPEIERPYEALGVEPGASYLDNPGFPSDHALFVWAILLAVWCETRKKLISGVLLVMVLAVCVGRVIALVHTPIDVVGAIVIAGVGALWYLTRDPRESKLPIL